jgi:type II secretion system protein H
MNHLHHAKGFTTHGHAGFTLIEIMLVLTMMAVLSALIAPSFFDAAGGKVEAEARLLQKMLRMVSEEAQLAGKPIQMRVYHDHLDFYTPSQDKTWQPFSNAVIQAYTWPTPVQCNEALLDGDIGMTLSDNTGLDGKKTPPPLARFLFWPDGSLTAGSLSLRHGDKGKSETIRLEPGPGGIHLLKAAP